MNNVIHEHYLQKEKELRNKSKAPLSNSELQRLIKEEKTKEYLAKKKTPNKKPKNKPHILLQNTATTIPIQEKIEENKNTKQKEKLDFREIALGGLFKDEKNKICENKINKINLSNQ